MTCPTDKASGELYDKSVARLDTSMVGMDDVFEVGMVRILTGVSVVLEETFETDAQC